MKRGIIWLGGLALLCATLFDTVAVVGRNIGWPVHGVIEVIQAAVLVAGGVALVLATLAGTHARVHLLIERLSPQQQHWAERFSALAMALFFAAMLCGSAWLAHDLRGAHEQSELLGVPWRWLRLFANLCLAGAAAALLGQAIRRKR